MRFQNITLTYSSGCLYNLSSKSPCEVYKYTLIQVFISKYRYLKWLANLRLDLTYSVYISVCVCSNANIQVSQECQPYFDCRDQFLLKWRAAINFPSFPEQFQKLKDVQPSKLQFHGLLHWSGSLFSADLFFSVSVFSFFS